MIKDFIKAWDANKKRLSTWFEKQNQYELSYQAILEALIREVINPFMEATGDYEWDVDKLHRIDDGDYQGCEIFIVPKTTYQPAPYDYFITYQYYGSCSGCDLLEGIRSYDNGTPNKEQVKEYMTLALHLLQRCKYLVSYEEEYGTE